MEYPITNLHLLYFTEFMSCVTDRLCSRNVSHEEEKIILLDIPLNYISNRNVTSFDSQRVRVHAYVDHMGEFFFMTKVMC